MNLSKLFEMQKALDAKIIEEKGLHDMDRLPYLILALQVELGECANEWRGFKYWSKDMEPRNKVKCMVCEGGREIWCGFEFDMITCPHCDGSGRENDSNPLLEEYVDCLHFILSIGLHDEDYEDFHSESYRFKSIVSAFHHTFDQAARLNLNVENWRYVMDSFLSLGYMLGFTWEQIEQAYIDKNAVNHERQSTGY